MKTKVFFLTCLMICVCLPIQSFAQGSYPNPDAARMRLLLAKFADCSNDQKNLQAELDALKEQEPNVNAELYAQAKNNLAILEQCKAAAQREYIDLRAKNEGWFGDSTSAMSIDRERITSVEVNEYVRRMLKLYIAAYTLYDGIIPP